MPGLRYLILGNPTEWMLSVDSVAIDRVSYWGSPTKSSGLHALQVADWLPITPLVGIPKLRWLGIYPSWQTLLPQLVLLGIAFALWVRQWLRADSAQRLSS